MGIVSANIFRNEDAQRKYLPAVITTAVFGATGAVIALSLGAYMTWDNARRDKIQGKKVKASQVSTGQLREGRKVVEWRWFL